MITIGIDPGIKGGVAAVATKTQRYEGGIRMPTIIVGKKTRVDAAALFRYLDSHDGNIERVVIEQVHAMPKQGVTSVFSFGHSAGVAEACAMLTGAPVEFVSPAKWKTHFGLTSDKRASLDAARRLFGHLWTRTLLADEGVAEAALIALYATRASGR